MRRVDLAAGRERLAGDAVGGEGGERRHGDQQQDGQQADAADRGGSRHLDFRDGAGGHDTVWPAGRDAPSFRERRSGLQHGGESTSCGGWVSSCWTITSASNPRDWVAAFATWNQARLADGLAALDATGAQVRRSSRPSLPPAGYAGTYADAWYGPIAITETGGRLRIDFRQTPGMQGTLTHWQYDTFRVAWDDAAIEPASVAFALDAAGKVAQIRMQAISPTADFSYDYQDLLFEPQAVK